MPEFKYNRADFKPLPVTLEHMDLCLRFFEDRVEGENVLRITARQPLTTVRLDAKGLTVHSVERVEDTGCEGALAYDYRANDNALIVALSPEVAEGETFSIRTRTTCVPSDHILEGIYRDTTPPGCPQQFMSQCQQWGFQRILPVFDDCTAKCTFRTTLEADARYTHLISNGDVCRETNPDGVPVPVPGDRSRQVITYINPIPMAPYLFIACAGTWDVLEDEVVYPSGRRVSLQYLVPPGRIEGARGPMAILKEAVLWQGRTQGYEYPREAYRTICMEKSNFGGMENVGNTTIITEAALIDEDISDLRLEYAHGVIVHEFEHNQCGSDVTMETPFDMWLNEAYTVDVERQFLASQLDPVCVRLDEIDAMRSPIGGPLAVEDAGHLGHIVREGFNDPDELVDGVTYVKAAEVIRMLRLVLGRETFNQGRDLYFSRHNGSNANTDQFFACFEEVSGRDLAPFRQEWLHTIGYPRIAAEWAWSEGRLQIDFSQERAGSGGLFHVPVDLAAVGEDGTELAGTAQVVEVTGPETRLSLTAPVEPAFVSFNRDCSFYGTFDDRSATPDRLRAQVRLDPNGFNRVEAMRRLTELERVKLLRDPDAAIDEAWLDVVGRVLRDGSLPPGLKAYLLRIDESSVDRRYLPWYRERYAARGRLLRAAAEAHLDALTAAFLAVDTYRPAAQPKDGIDERRLKAVLLRILTEADLPETQQLAEEHFTKAWNMTDRLSALHGINISGHPGRLALLDAAYDAWKERLAPYTSYLRIVASGTHNDVFELIEKEEQRESFHLEHPAHCRSLFLPMTANNKQVWTDRGIEWVTRNVIRIAPLNEFTANRLVACFQQAARLAEDLKPKVVGALEALRDAIPADKCPSVAGRVAAILDTVR